MILSRSLINKNIRFHDWIIRPDNLNIQEYNFNHLSSLVDAYKNCLLSKGATVGQSVIIGTRPKIEQIALILMCAELGLIVTVIGNPYSTLNPNNPQEFGYASLAPIDYFIVKNNNCTDKFHIFHNIAKTTIVLDDEQLDYTVNADIFATESSIFLKCTSEEYGNNIYHTHNFIVSLFKRNSQYFYGKMGMLLDNINHSSSPCMHFLPALLSDNVTDYYNFSTIRNAPTILAKSLEENNLSIDHLMVPYMHLIDEFLNSDLKLPKSIIYTLTQIQEKWTYKIANKLKDIISIFGSSETYGPLLINNATETYFYENSYKELDNFYKIETTQNHELVVRVPTCHLWR